MVNYNLQKETKEDVVLKKILQYCYHEWPKNMQLESNVELYFNIRNEIIVNDSVLY